MTVGNIVFLLAVSVLLTTALQEIKNPVFQGWGEIQRQSGKLRVINGTEAVMHEFPFMAMLTTADGWQFCGGSLISNDWVLTAAHCVESVKDSPWEMRVRLGDHDKYLETETEHQVIEVSHIIIHEGFIAWNLTNDIALLRLRNPVEFSRNIFQVCISPWDMQFVGEQVTAVGWGAIDLKGSSSDVLLKTDKTVWSHSDCVEAMKEPRLDHALYGGSICAYNRDSDVCFGDSGGPLLWKDIWYGEWRLIGLVSWGLCKTEEVPAVYTRINYFNDWILHHTYGAQIC